VSRPYPTIRALGLLLLVLAQAVPARGDDAAPTLYQQGLEATYRGDYPTARTHLEAWLAEHPADGDAIQALARVEFWTNRYPEAAALYEQLLARRPHDLDARVELAHTLFWMGELPRAEAAVRAAVAVEPENVQANLILAAVLQETGRGEEADRVYNWILEIEPDNPGAKNRRALLRPAPAAGDAFVLSSRNLLSGDNFDFLGFRSVTGLAMGFFGFLTLEPELHIRVIDDTRVRSPYAGLGPGLRLGFSTGTPVSAWIAGSWVPLMGRERTVHGWAAAAGLDLRFEKGPSLSAAVGTDLHGLERQSALAVYAGLRRYEGSLSLYYAPAWFRLEASASLGGVFDGDADLGLNASWWLSPAFRLTDGAWKLYAGYGLWGMVYPDPAPVLPAPATGVAAPAYWDPAAALSHVLFLDLDGRLHEDWRLLATVGGGLAQERGRAVAGRAATWTSAGLVNGRLAFGWTPSPAFEARLGGGFGLSSRGGDPYTSWNVLLDLTGRW